MVSEEVVALECQKGPSELTLAAHDLRDRDGRVVIARAKRHPIEELEARHVSCLEGLCALSRIGGEEVGVRVRQRDDPERGLGAHAGDLDHGDAEVELGMAGRV